MFFDVGDCVSMFNIYEKKRNIALHETGVRIITSKFSIVSHKRCALLRDAGRQRQWHGHAARALRSKIKLVRHVIPNRRPPKQRNSAQISLQACYVCFSVGIKVYVHGLCIFYATDICHCICICNDKSAVIIKVGKWSWISWSLCALRMRRVMKSNLINLRENSWDIAGII